MEAKYNRGSLALGMVLIVAGIMFFIARYFGFPGWEALWPLIVIGAGATLFVSRASLLLTRRGRPGWEEGDLFWPALLMGFGLVWLLVNLGLAPLANATALFGLWPALLIAAGLDLITARRLPWVGALAGGLVVAGALWLVFNPGRIPLPPVNLSPGSDTGEVVRLTGSGQLIERVYDVKKYDRINFSSGGVAQIVQGEQEGVRVTVDENLADYLVVEARGGELRLQARPGYSLAPSQPLRFTVFVRNLSRVDASGSSEFRIDGLRARRLELSSSNLATFAIQGLQAQDLRVSLNGSGQAEVSGAAERLRLEIKGAGNFQAGDLKSSRVQLQITGAGLAVVWASERLEIGIKGAGNVSYYGSPRVTQKISGLGQIYPLGEK